MIPGASAGGAGRDRARALENPRAFGEPPREVEAGAYTPRVRHVVFLVGSERYALPLAAVREVVVPGMLSRVPRAPDAVRGIMNLRGRVVTVVDLGMLFGVAPSPGPGQAGLTALANSAPTGKIVLLDRGRRDLGLLVREVDGILSVEEIAPAPGEAMPSVRGVARVPAGAVTVLDAEGLDAQVAGLFKP